MLRHDSGVRSGRSFLLCGHLVLLLACSSGTNEVLERRATIFEDDGTVSFYRGKDIGKRLSEGRSLGGPGDKQSFMRLRVSKDLVDRVTEIPSGVVTMSLEEPNIENGSIEITVHTNALRRDSGEYDTLVFRPGDPFVTGYAQIARRADGSKQGFFQVTRYVRSAIGSYAQQIFETGLAPDTNMPDLKFDGNPRQWPPLPPHWKP